MVHLERITEPTRQPCEKAWDGCRAPVRWLIWWEWGHERHIRKYYCDVHLPERYRKQEVKK